MSRFRAQCATCMRVNEDPLALACPACGSRRLVVLVGQRPAIPQDCRRLGRPAAVTRPATIGRDRSPGSAGVLKASAEAHLSPPPGRADVAGSKGGQATHRIRRGSTVVLDSAQGPIERKVIEVAGDVLVIAREETVREAKKVGRKPRGIGFKRGDVLSVKRNSRPTVATPRLSARRCQGQTSRGKPCRHSALLGRDFCGDHEPSRAALPQVAAEKPPLEVRLLPAGAEYDEPLAAIIYRALKRAEQIYPGEVRRDGEFLSAPLPVALAGLLAEAAEAPAP